MCHSADDFCLLSIIFTSCHLTLLIVIIIVILEGEECAVCAEHVLDGRRARWAWRTDDCGHVVKGSYVLTRPLEARSMS